MDSAFRHMAKYMEGENDEPHLVAALWNLAWAVQFEAVMPEMQDIPARRSCDTCAFDLCLDKARWRANKGK
jgi:hypothetical protein